MKQLFTFFLLVTTTLVYSQRVEQLVVDIAKDGSLGFDQNQQYNRFISLNEVASLEQLVELTDHKSPAVRGYAFWALAKRQYIDLKSIFIAHLEDSEQVYQKNGCMVGKESVISFMRQVATPYMYDPDCKKLDSQTLNRVQSN